MVRYKTYDATGVAPNGRLTAGDLNLFQDLVAALTDLTQNISAGSLAVGESGLTITRFGAGEFQLAGLVRIQGIARFLSGFIGGTFTTTQRDAIAGGSRPYGLIILNSTTNQYEWNKGTDGAPNWQPLNPPISAGAVGNTELAANAVTNDKIAAGHGGSDDYNTTFPSSGLFNGYEHTIFLTDPVTGLNQYRCVYRADLDGTNPWHVNGPPLAKESSVVTAAGWPTSMFTVTAPKAGYYISRYSIEGHEPTNAWQVLSGAGINGVLQEGGQAPNGITNGSSTWFVREFNILLAATDVINALIGNNSGGAVTANFWASLSLTPRKIH